MPQRSNRLTSNEANNALEESHHLFRSRNKCAGRVWYLRAWQRATLYHHSANQ